MTREEVIRGLECCGYSQFIDKCQECPYDGKDCFRRLKIDALALLKAQEPVEPAWRRGKAFCGKCGLGLHKVVEQNNYCPNCGRKVKWG